MKLQRIIEASGGRIRRQPNGCPPSLPGAVGLPGIVTIKTYVNITVHI